MTVKVAINGFGRIGRNVLRAIIESGRTDIEVIAINDLGPVETNAHLLQFDSVHGRFPVEVKTTETSIDVGRGPIKVTAIRNPADLPWGASQVDLVVESTGVFADAEKASAHLTAGAGKVIISAPAKGDLKTVVLGVNDDILTADDRIVSNASCTTICLAPMAKVLNDTFGLETGYITTIHAYTADQRLQDAPHKDLRRARAAALSMIPTSTGAAKAVAKVLPQLEGKLTGNAIRVPTPNVSMAILNLTLNRPTNRDELNEFMRETALHSSMKKQIDYSNSPEVVSSDFVGSRAACVFDAKATIVNGNQAVLYLWYDNEYGYSCQVYRVLEQMAGIRYQTYPVNGPYPL